MDDENKKYFEGTRALVVGLGLHGGGIATAKWLANHGAKVTVTDKRERKLLHESIKALKGIPVRFVLGTHRAKDFREADMVIVGPAVPRESPYVAIAQKAGKRIENDTSLFFAHNTNPVIGVTGTRGKTTTTLWIAEILKKKYRDVLPSGNTPENALLKEFERIEGKKIPVVAELSSWQLEYLPTSKKAPHIAVITNLFPDHLNRYGGRMSAYAKAKANIFLHQTKEDILILNRDNEWWKFFAKKKTASKIFFISKKILPKKLNGLYVANGYAVFRVDGKTTRIAPIARFVRERGTHNLENLLATLLAVKLFDPKITLSESAMIKLPSPRFRQEIISTKKNLLVVNDSCATSPDGTIAGIERFVKMGHIVLIAGGTDKQLDFAELALYIARNIRPENLVLLDGSATESLVKKLRKHGFPNIPYETLEECTRVAFASAGKHKGKKVILFSPGAASFEKFLHEFDRGEKWSALVKKILK